MNVSNSFRFINEHVLFSVLLLTNGIDCLYYDVLIYILES